MSDRQFNLMQPLVRHTVFLSKNSQPSEMRRRWLRSGRGRTGRCSPRKNAPESDENKTLCGPAGMSYTAPTKDGPVEYAGKSTLTVPKMFQGWRSNLRTNRKAWWLGLTKTEEARSWLSHSRCCSDP